MRFLVFGKDEGREGQEQSIRRGTPILQWYAQASAAAMETHGSAARDVTKAAVVNLPEPKQPEIQHVKHMAQNPNIQKAKWVITPPRKRKLHFNWPRLYIVGI